MNQSKSDSLVIRDATSRRKFIRSGAVLLAVSSTLSTSQLVYGDECDRAKGMEKKPNQPGSDSDAGENSDPAGCGKKAPKVTRHYESEEELPAVSVRKIIS